MVTNEFDPCCYSGRFADTFKTIVSARVNTLGQGQWGHYLDSTATDHEISANTLNTIILPALGVGH